MHHKGAKQCNMTLALALEPSLFGNSAGMSSQRVCLPVNSYAIVDVEDLVIV
jgi:hypothetical protein